VNLVAMDFVGQEVYCASHQFFLSWAGVNLVLFDASLGDESQVRVKPRLESIRSRIASPRS
jgi:hypothetical protein